MSHVNYTSADFDEMGREELVKIFEQKVLGLFYHVQIIKEIPIPKFQPHLLSSFFRIVYHVKTIKPENPKNLGFMHYYDYDEGMYLPKATVFFKEFIKKHWKDKYLDIPKQQLWDDLTASTYIDREDFTLDSKYIPVGNGTLVLVKNNDRYELDFISNSPELLTTLRIPTLHIPSAKPVNFLKQLETCLPNKPIAHKRIQEWFGTCLHRLQLFDYAILPVGDGDNGKTTLFSVFRQVLGLKNTTNISLHDLTYNRFFTARLENKLANIGDDLSKRDLRAYDRFLKLTGGGEQFTVERKGIDSYEVDITAKLGWPANDLPYIDSLTNAFLRRWLIIFFDVVFTNDPKRKNQITKELTTPEEKSGILNWGLEGLLRVLNNDRFSDPPSIEENRATWRSRSANAVVRFMYSGLVKIEPEEFYLMSDFISDINVFARNKKIPTLTGKKIGITINKTFPEITRTNRKHNDKQTWFYKGIKPKDKSYLLDSEKEEADRNRATEEFE